MRTKTMRAKRKIPLGLKPIAQDIEEGKDIRGQKGFVRLDFDGKDVFVPVTIQGMQVSAKGACGISLLVKPQGGFEDFETSPCDYYSSKQEIELIRESQAKIENALCDYKEIGKWGTAVARKRATEEYVTKHGLQTLYDEEMGKEVSDGQRAKVVGILVSVVYNLSPAELDSLSFSGWRSGRY